MAGAWRARQWLGRPTGKLMVAMLPQPRQLTIVAVRTDPLRVVVSASAPLAHGDVRGTRIRLVGAVAAVLADLRRTARLPMAAPLVCLLDACPDPGAVPGRTATAAEPVPTIDGGQRLAYERAAREAGFAPFGVLTRPDALSRQTSIPVVHSARHAVLPRDGELLVTAAVVAVRGELPAVHPEVDVQAPADWSVELVTDQVGAGAGW